MKFLNPLIRKDLKCDTCGAQATTVARDIIRTDRPGDQWKAYKPAPLLKVGCDAHPVESQEIR